MVITRRIFFVVFAAAVIVVSLDSDTRRTMRAFIHESYILVTGDATPRPLERPLFLGQAGLHDCLRGNTPVESDGAYAAFCADLASLVEPAAVAAKAPPLRPADFPARPESVAGAEKAALAPEREPGPQPEPQCRVDAAGIVSTSIDGVWIAREPKPDRETALDGKPSRTTLVPPGCAVQSPADAEVLYAGTFKGYLGIVILDTGRADRLTVAGLGTLDVRRGDRIFRGATIGWMPERAAPALANAAMDGDAVLLYVEGTAAEDPPG